MKKILLLVGVLALLSYAQVVKTETDPVFGHQVFLSHSFTLSTSATQYSDAFAGSQYLPKDSTKFFTVSYSATDTAVVTITLEGKNSTTDAWTTVGTVATNYAPSGNDSLSSKLGFIYNGNSSSAAHAGKMFNLGGSIPNWLRVKLAFTNKTTVGNSGAVKIYIKFYK